MAVDPSGKYLYVLDTGDIVTSVQIYGFDITAGGAIGSAIVGTPPPTGLGATSIVTDPTSSLIGVTNNFDTHGNISLFSIGAAGALTADAPVTTGVNSVVATSSAQLFMVFYNAP